MLRRALLAFLFIATSVVHAASNRTWIADVTIISPEKLDRIEKGSVLIEDGRIARVERGAHAKKPAGATVVSGKGKFLIPGLIDSHVHLAALPGMKLDVMLEPAAAKPAMVRDYLAQLPRSYLYFGYTTLVDLAVVDRQVLDDFRRAPQHPDLYDCAQSLPVANGYPMALAPPDIRFKLFPNFIDETHPPAAAVANVKRAGGVCVKTYFERGFGADRNLPVISAGLLAQVRKAATDAGLVLMMHANSLEAQKFAAAGDVDVIAHGMWNGFATQPELPSEVRSVLDEIARKRIGYQPTIQVLQGLRAYFDPEYLHTKAIPKVIPAELLAWFNTPEGHWFKAEVAQQGVPDAAMFQGIENGPMRRVRQVVAYLGGKDANFLFGTDTPSAPTYGNLPGLNGYLEMQQWQKAGLSLAQILEAATINNAREFHLDAQLGTIEPGKIANLVLLDKSPLESVEAYDSIVTVWVHGAAIPRERLAAR
jgi:imidazolonepropionase-like amidohydrolase